MKGKQIYVSRYSGKDFLSCGETIESACKTIGRAVTQAQWNDTICIDGTGTSRDPYPCSSGTSDPEQIYINMSLSFERYGESEAILQCSSSRQMLFDGRNFIRNVVIRFSGLTFLNSHVTVQNCSLFVDSCHFKDAMSFPNATGVVHFESFDEHDLSLRVGRSKFSNNGFPCIYVLGSRPKIQIFETAFINNTANGTSALFKWIYQSIFMVLLPTQRLRYPGTSVSLTSSLFVGNKAPLGGCLHLEGIISGETTNSQYQRHRTKKTQIRNVDNKSHLFFSSETGRLLSIGKVSFYRNLGRAITLTTLDSVNTLITSCKFVNNGSPYYGGAIYIYVAGPFLNIVDSEFIENSAQISGSAIYFSPSFFGVYSVLVRKSLLLENVITGYDPSSSEGGALAIDCPDCNNMTIRLEEVSFMYNSAANGSSTLWLDVWTSNISIVDSFFVGNSLHNKRFYYGLAIAHISSGFLGLFVIRTLISGNYAERWADKNKRPFLLFINSGCHIEINIDGLQYKNNKDSGIRVEVSDVQGLKSHTVSIANAHFKNNELFSINFTVRGNSLVQIKNTSFRGNAYLSSNVPLFSFYSLTQGNNITIEDAIFENNTSPGVIVLFQFPPDNIDREVCNWYDYKNEVRLTNVLFRKNKALNPSIIRLESGWNVFSECQFVDNDASYTVFVGESSTNLELTDTSFHKSSQWEETFSGFIYFASSGPIKLKNTTLIAKPFQDIDSYFMVTGSNSSNIDNSSTIQCPIGTLQSLRNFTHLRLNSNGYCRYEIYETIAQSFTYSCKRCPPGYYSVEPSGKSCRPCPYGGNCTRNIAASPTFWGFPSLDDHGSVSFQQCPTDYCCPYRNVSCKYENQRYLASGCSGNRTGVLCGQCKSGYTETLFSAKCRENNNCEDYWFWPVVLLYSFAFSFFLLRKSSIICYARRILPWARKRAAVCDLTSDGSGYVKVIFYFYQVAGLVFVSKDSEMHLAENYLLLPVMGWFDFKAIGLKGGLVCPFLGLTVVSKIFLQASQVFAVLFGVLLIFVVNGVTRKLQRKRPVFPPADQYLAATVDCLLLSYSTLALTALKALNCVPIQSTSRFFYDGNIQCWTWWQKLCAVFIFMYIVPFVSVLYSGSKLLYSKEISSKRFLYACLCPLPFAIWWMVFCKKIPPTNAETHQVSDEQLPLVPPRARSSRNDIPVQDSTAKVIYGPFKECIDGQDSGAVFWESVLIARRLVLISLHTFIVFPFIRMVCLSIACAFILVHHLWKRPFKDPCVNRGETASLAALLVLVVINMVELIFSLSGGTISEQDRICLVVLNVVEVIIIGILPVVFVLVILFSLLWQLLRISRFFCLIFCRLCVTNRCEN